MRVLVVFSLVAVLCMSQTGGSSYYGSSGYGSSTYGGGDCHDTGTCGSSYYGSSGYGSSTYNCVMLGICGNDTGSSYYGGSSYYDCHYWGTCPPCENSANYFNCMPPDGGLLPPPDGGMPPEWGNVGTNDWMNSFMDTSRQMEINIQNTYLSISGEQVKYDYGSSYYSSYYDYSDAINFYTELKNEVDNLMTMNFDYTYTGGEYDVDTSLAVNLIGIVEYTESGDNAGYQEGEDEVTMTISQVEWSDWSDISADNGSVKSYSADGYGGIVRIIVYVTDSAATLDNGQELNANEIKFDLMLNGYPFMGFETRLAACFSVSTDGDIYEADGDLGVDPTQLAVDSSSGLTSGFFSWVDHVETSYDGAETASIVVSSNGGKYCFSIDTTAQPGYIYWDPSIGVSAISSAYEESNAASVQSVLLAVVVLLLAMLFQ